MNPSFSPHVSTSAPYPISYGALMEASAAGGAGGGEQWTRSLELLNEMLEREVLPTNSFVSALVELCSRAGKLAELPGLIDHMEAHEVQIKEAMYARAMHALAKAGRCVTACVHKEPFERRSGRPV